MVYIYIFVPLLFIGFFVWNTIRGNRELKRVKEYLRKPNTVRLALWIDLNKINGEEPDYTYSYWKNVRSNVSDSNSDVLILLLQSGSYDLIASSNSSEEYKSISVKVDLEPGRTYQLGCNEDGVYLIEDSEPDRYNL